MKLALRMDDIAPDMDYVKFERFRQMLDAHGICPLIGVVPENRDKTLHCGSGPERTFCAGTALRRICSWRRPTAMTARR